MIDNESILPKYYQIKEYIKSKIINGEIKPDERIMSENEIIKQYEVSRQPVIQAMKELEKEGWIYRIQGKGTFCSPRNVKKYKNVGIVLNAAENYIFVQVVAGITSALSARNYNGIIKNVRYSPVDEKEAILDMIDNNVSGFILNFQYQHDEFSKETGILSKIVQKDIPFVLTDGYAELTDIPFVVPDDIKGGYIATKHLLDLGHRNIMLFSPHMGWVEKSRFKGYAKALNEYGIEVKNEYLILGIKEEFDYEDFWGVYGNSDRGLCSTKTDITKTSCFRKIKDVLNTYPEITAAFCYNDLYAKLLLDSLECLGKKVPEDFSVVGFDDSIIAVSGDVKLTTVAHPKFSYGSRVAEVLLDIIEGKKPRNYHEIVDVHLVIRDSCRKI